MELKNIWKLVRWDKHLKIKRAVTNNVRLFLKNND